MKGVLASAVTAALILSTVTSARPAAAASPAQKVAVPPPEPPPPPPPPPPPQPGPPKRWYGWEILVGHLYSDVYLGIGTALAVKGDIDMALPFLVLGYGGHIVTGGIVHKVHDNETKSKGSLGVNVGPMLVGFVTGALALGCKGIEHTKACDDRMRTGMAVGSAVGAVVGGIIEVSAMCYETGYGSGRSRLSVRPMGVGMNGGGLSVGGEF